MNLKLNFFRQNLKLGFSMIEILVSISIFVVLSLASVNLFLRTTVGSTRDNSTRSLKQTGDHIISVLDNSLRSSGGIAPNTDNPPKTCAKDMKSISIYNLDRTMTEVWNVATSESGNSQIMVNNQPITSDDLMVIDNQLFINCTQDQSSGATFVNVKFTLGKKSGSFDTESRTEKNLTETFETSVNIRNR